MNEDQIKNSDVNAVFVNIYREEDAEKWSDYFGITKMELNNAVIAAGKSSLAIKKYLERIKLAKVEREKKLLM